MIQFLSPPSGFAPGCSIRDFYLNVIRRHGLFSSKSLYLLGENHPFLENGHLTTTICLPQQSHEIILSGVAATNGYS